MNAHVLLTIKRGERDKIRGLPRVFALGSKGFWFEPCLVIVLCP